MTTTGSPMPQVANEHSLNDQRGDVGQRLRGASHNPPSQTAVILALLGVYTIWGSTYLAIRLAVAGYPPFLMAGFRFIVGGVILFGILRLNGQPNPTLRQWVAAAGVGICLTGAIALTGIAEKSVSSGLTATIVAAVPLWAAIISGFWSNWPDRREWAGIIVGLAGVTLLELRGDLHASPIGAIILLLVPILWAFGSIWGKQLPLPHGLMASAAEQITGGFLVFFVGLGLHEHVRHQTGLAPTLALAYLVVFGSILGLGAYAFLLANVRPALATSYAYINPVVAVILGALLVGEKVSATDAIAMSVILGGVILIVRDRSRKNGANDRRGKERDTG